MPVCLEAMSCIEKHCNISVPYSTVEIADPLKKIFVIEIEPALFPADHLKSKCRQCARNRFCIVARIRKMPGIDIVTIAYNQCDASLTSCHRTYHLGRTKPPIRHLVYWL